MLDRIDELVIKPVEGSGGYGIVFGPDASEKSWRPSVKKIRATRAAGSPASGQLSTVPTKVGDSLVPATWTCGRSPSTTARTWVLPGGLTRWPHRGLAGGQFQPGRRIKDTWVLASRSSVAARELVAAEIVRKPPKPVKPADGGGLRSSPASSRASTATTTAAAGGDAR